MTCEPAQVLYNFSNRAQRWERQLNYSDVNSVKGENISTTRYFFPALSDEMIDKKIAFFSDVHYRDNEKNETHVDEAVEIIREFDPDYLLSGGDLADYATETYLLPKLLQKFDGIGKTKLAVLGNWEYRKLWLDVDWWADIYRKHGFTLLDNEMYNDENIDIYGAADPTTGRLIIPTWTGEEKMRLIVAHHPDAIIALDSSRVGQLQAQLSICGHTHGGQVRLPLIGALHSSSIYGRKFDYGVYANNMTGNQMVISSGLGERSFPFRFLCRREVVLIEFVEF